MKEVGLSFVTRLDSVEGRRISDNPGSSMCATIILAKFCVLYILYLLSSRPNNLIAKINCNYTMKEHQITNHQSYVLTCSKRLDLVNLKISITLKHETFQLN